MTEFPVVIVGGGPVGLTASILLSRAGIRSLLVERHQRRVTHTAQGQAQRVSPCAVFPASACLP